MNACVIACRRLVRNKHMSHFNRVQRRIEKTVNEISASERDVQNVLMDPTLMENEIHSTLLDQAQHSLIIEQKNVSSDKQENTERLKSFLSKIGKIEHIEPLEFLEANRYIVQFQKRDSVSYLLNRGRDGRIDNHMVSLKHDQDSVDDGNPQPQQDGIQKTKRKSKPMNEKKELHKILDEQDTMEQQMQILVNRSLITSSEIRVRYLFLHILENVFRKHLDPSYEIRPYGSSLTGGGKTGTDMDIVLLSRSYRSKMSSPLPQRHAVVDTEQDELMEMKLRNVAILEQAEQILKKHLTDAHDFDLILSARVPILDFNFPAMNLSIDLCVNQMCGINFANIVNWYIRRDARVRPLLMTVRAWGEARGLLSHGVDFNGFTPFMLQMLTLVFLMRMDVIPPLRLIGRRHRDKFVIFKPPAGFSNQTSNTKTSEDLFCEFFKYFSMNGLMGSRYHLSVGKISRVGFGFSIQNPFDNHVNMAQNCHPDKVVEMTEEMKKTARLLEFRRKKLTHKDWGLNAVFSTGS